MIQNNSTQINNFWFDVVMPVLNSLDWHLLTLFLQKNELTVEAIDEILSETGLVIQARLKSLEEQGFIVKDGKNYLLSLDDSKYKIKRKKARQIKEKALEFETIDIPSEDVLNWQNFLRSTPMAPHIREILWRVYVATGRDINSPWTNIPDINLWQKQAKAAWDLSEQNMELIIKVILELTSKKFPIASPKSLLNTIPWMKTKLKESKEDNNVADVGGWLR